MSKNKKVNKPNNSKSNVAADDEDWDSILASEIKKNVEKVEPTKQLQNETEEPAVEEIKVSNPNLLEELDREDDEDDEEADGGDATKKVIVIFTEIPPHVYGQLTFIILG